MSTKNAENPENAENTVGIKNNLLHLQGANNACTQMDVLSAVLPKVLYQSMHNSCPMVYRIQKLDMSSRQLSLYRISMSDKGLQRTTCIDVSIEQVHKILYCTGVHDEKGSWIYEDDTVLITYVDVHGVDTQGVPSTCKKLRRVIRNTSTGDFHLIPFNTYDSLTTHLERTVCERTQCVRSTDNFEFNNTLLEFPLLKELRVHDPCQNCALFEDPKFAHKCLVCGTPVHTQSTVNDMLSIKIVSDDGAGLAQHDVDLD